MSSLALLQMWVTEEAGHVFRSPSWGILDQDDTRCLFQGIPDLEEPRCGATGAHRSSDSVHLFQFDTYFDCCDGKLFAYLTPQCLM